MYTKVTHFIILYLLIFFLFQIILLLLYIFSIYNLCFYRKNPFLAFHKILSYSCSFGRNIPNSKSMLSMKLLISGKNLCSHMYVSKQITNLKCDTKSKQNIDDELVCRLKNHSSDRQIRSKRTRYRRIRNRRTRNRRTLNRQTLNRRTRNRWTDRKSVV